MSPSLNSSPERYTWRVEPIISAARQAELDERRNVVPDIESGIFPFGGQALSRADIEWLLATHGEGQGPVVWVEVGQKERQGLDLRGANLSGLNLSHLPLTKVRGSLSEREWQGASPEQRAKAVVRLVDVDLSEAELQGADLIEVQFVKVNLQSAYLSEARLQRAQFTQVNMQGANLWQAHLAGITLTTDFIATKSGLSAFAPPSLHGASFLQAHLEGASLRQARLLGADFSLARLDGANLNFTDMSGASLRGAVLSGASLQRATMEGTSLSDANLGGHQVGEEMLQQVRPWIPDFPDMLPPAVLVGATLDSKTNVSRVSLGNQAHGFASMADVYWGGADLSLVDWEHVGRLGDESEARNPKKRDGSAKARNQRHKEFQAAARGYRQLSVALQTQGLEESTRFAYRARIMQRTAAWHQWHTKRWQLGTLGYAISSWTLWYITGYGYRLRHSVGVYCLVNIVFAVLYWAIAGVSPSEAIFVSLAAFHGRGFQPDLYHPGQAGTYISGLEASIGLVVEAVLIATLTQKLFGK